MQSRVVQCYHCRAPFEVGARAMTVACAKCGRRVIVHNIKVKDAQGVTKLQTCGHITIEKRGTVIAQLVEAHEGLEVLGTLESKQILVRGPCRLGPKATVKGDLKAAWIEIDPGAKIKGGRFQIADPSNRSEWEMDVLPGVDPQDAAARTAIKPAEPKKKPLASAPRAQRTAPSSQAPPPPPPQKSQGAAKPSATIESKPKVTASGADEAAAKPPVKKKKVLRKKVKKKAARKVAEAD